MPPSSLPVGPGHLPRTARLQRSELAVPATRPHFFEKAAAGAADALFLDLEDAVAPAHKAQARAQAIQALNGIDWGTKTVAVRVNGLDTPWALEDIVEVARRAPRVDLLLLPKAGSAFDVQFVDQLLTLVERENPGLRGTRGPIGLEVLIESARGVAQAEAIAAASPRLEAMIFGVGDYTVDMRTRDTVFGRPSARYAVPADVQSDGSRPAHWNDQWHYALARIANACRAHGLRPVDGPYTDFRDEAGYRACARRAAALGYEGKWAVHPSQVATANEVFSPDAQELQWAQRVRELLARTTAEGQGAVADAGTLVDMAHLKLVEQIEQRQALIRAHAQGRREA